MENRHWEIVTGTILDNSPYTTRLPVPGGWIYRVHAYDGDLTPAVCFVPYAPYKNSSSVPANVVGPYSGK